MKVQKEQLVRFGKISDNLNNSFAKQHSSNVFLTRLFEMRSQNDNNHHFYRPTLDLFPLGISICISYAFDYEIAQILFTIIQLPEGNTTILKNIAYIKKKKCAWRRRLLRCIKIVGSTVPL